MSLFGAIPELIEEELHAWVERERQKTPGGAADMLMSALASRLGLKHKRQVYRYRSGETPFPLEKLVAFCRAIGSWTLLQAVNQDASLVAEPKPDPGTLDLFDLHSEQSRNLKEFGELVSAYAQATDEVPSELTLRRAVSKFRH